MDSPGAADLYEAQPGSSAGRRRRSTAWDNTAGDSKPTSAEALTPTRGREPTTKRDSQNAVGLAAGRGLSPGVKRDSSGNARDGSPLCNDRVGDTINEAWMPSKRSSTPSGAGRSSLGLNAGAAGQPTAAAAGTPNRFSSKSYTATGAAPNTSRLSPLCTQPGKLDLCKMLTAKYAIQDQQTQEAATKAASLLRGRAAALLRGVQASLQDVHIGGTPSAPTTLKSPAGPSAQHQEGQQTGKNMLVNSLLSSPSIPAASQDTSSGDDPIKIWDLKASRLGETEHGNGLQGDARQDAGNIQLSGRPQQPERTFQGETVALTPEHLSMLIECLTLNSPLFQAYSRERLGLEAAELVAMSSGQVVQCMVLCPGAKPEQLALILDGKEGSGAFGAFTHCRILPSSGSDWVRQQHTEYLQDRMQEQPAAEGDINQMLFALKLLHFPEPMQNFVQEGQPQPNVCFTKSMRAAYREALAMISCQGPHTCKGLGMVLIPVPAAPITPADGAAAAAIAKQLATEGVGILHPVDRPPTALDHNTGTHFPKILLYAGLLMHAYSGSLADIIAARQAHGECLSMEEALLLLVQMLYGAESGHEAGVVHHDIKPANVLFGKSPYNSPAEQEELLRLLKIGALAAINVCSIIPSVSDFGGASKGGLARKPTSGYGTRMYRAPELKTAVAHPVVNMALADVFSTAITHLKLRGYEYLFYLLDQASGPSKLLEELESSGTMQQAEVDLLRHMLCHHSQRLTCGALRQKSALLQRAEAQLRDLQASSTRAGVIQQIQDAVDQDRKAGKLRLPWLANPAPVQLPTYYEQRQPSGCAGAAGAAGGNQCIPLAAQQLLGHAAAQGQQQLDGQPPLIYHTCQDGVLGAGSSSSVGPFGLEVVGGGVLGRVQQHVQPPWKRQPWSKDMQPIGMAGQVQQQQQQVPAPHLQQQLLPQGNFAPLAPPAFYERRTPSGFAGAAGGQQDNPLTAQRLHHGLAAAQGQQQLGGQQQQQPTHTYDTYQGRALGAGSNSMVEMFSLEVVGGGVPGRGQQQGLPPSQPEPLAGAEHKLPICMSSHVQQQQQVPAPHLQQHLLPQGNSAPLAAPAFYEQRTPSGFAGAAGGQQDNPLTAQRLHHGLAAAQGQQQLGGQQQQQPTHIYDTYQGGGLGAGSMVEMFSLEVVGGGVPGRAQQQGLPPSQPAPLAWGEDRGPIVCSSPHQGLHVAAPYMQQQPGQAHQQVAAPAPPQALLWAEDRRPAGYGLAPLSAQE